jgi:hypothetical protein
VIAESLTFSHEVAEYRAYEDDRLVALGRKPVLDAFDDCLREIERDVDFARQGRRSAIPLANPT